MPFYTLIYAVFLILLGAVTPLILGHEASSRTAMIPFIMGGLFLLLGGLGYFESIRKHVMHAAAALALLGVIMPIVRLVISLMKGPGPSAIILGLMVVGTVAYLALSINSFIQARNRRLQAAATNG